MLHKLKLTIITLGIASGMTAAALAYQHNVPTCQSMVLRDLARQSEFQQNLARYQVPQDFITAMTKGK